MGDREVVSFERIESSIGRVEVDILVEKDLMA